MEDDIFSQSVNKLISRASSTDPTPGGGSVSIISGVLGISLIQMAISISKNNSDIDLNESLSNLESIVLSLKNHCCGDMKVFDSYMKAVKMSKHNEKEINQRETALLKITLESLDITIESSRIMLNAIETGFNNIEYIKKSVISDVYAGFEIVSSAIIANLLNIDINLSPKRMEDVKSNYKNMKEDIIDSVKIYRLKFDSYAKKDGFIL